MANLENDMAEVFSAEERAEACWATATRASGIEGAAWAIAAALFQVSETAAELLAHPGSHDHLGRDEVLPRPDKEVAISPLVYAMRERRAQTDRVVAALRDIGTGSQGGPGALEFIGMMLRDELAPAILRRDDT